MVRKQRLKLKIGTALWLIFFALVNSTHAEQSWQRSAANPVLYGNGGSIIQVSDPCVIHDAGKFRMWFACVGVDSNFSSIGYAESSDGDSWSVPIVVFSPGISGSWDDQTVDIPYVIKDDEEADPTKRYKMWYGGSNSVFPNITKIGLAYSMDGIVWNRLLASQSPYGLEGLSMIAENGGNGDYGMVGEASVIKWNGIFQMWYNSWDDDNSVAVSYATSADGANWMKYSGNPVLKYTAGSWEAYNGPEASGTVAQPTVLWDETRSAYMMWYGSFDNISDSTYSGIGFADSPDGINWRKNNQPVFVHDHESPGEETAISSGPFVLKQDGAYHLWYTGVTDKRVISHATMAIDYPPNAPSGLLVE